jgi:dimethylargininase
MRSVAVMRQPARNYSGEVGRGRVNWGLAVKQHTDLQRIYRRHGYKVELLTPSMKYVGSTFMQDAAFVNGDQAILLNLLSSWRTKEARHNRYELEKVLSKYVHVERLGLPALLDAGEIVVTDREILVGIACKAARRAVAQIRAKMDLDRPLRTWTPKDHHEYVHMGSEMSYIGEDCLLTTKQFSKLPATRRYSWTYVTEKGEEDGANAVLLHDGTLLMQEGCPETVALLRREGWEVETVDISEFNKGMGHLSCLSINFTV